MGLPSHILAFRFSALGDVAMTVPVINLLLKQYPELKVTVVTVPFHKPLFDGMERLNFYGVDIKNEFKGLKGLYNLAGQLKKDIAFDAVADLHDVLRTKLIRNWLKNVPLAVIDKGRAEKKKLTRKKNKKLKPLKTTFERYAEVFEKLGLPVKLLKADGILSPIANETLLPVSHKENKLIGIAPFAKHAAKMYPLEKMAEVVQILQKRQHTQLFLFGSKAEAPLLEKWADADNVHLVAGNLSFSEELNLISQMDLMLTMDSANMHLASLYGIPVVSVWGGTHPFLGFYGWAQDIQNAVQLDLPCRPSSVYGKNDCPVHGKGGCMQGISAGMIVEKIDGILAKQ